MLIWVVKLENGVCNVKLIVVCQLTMNRLDYNTNGFVFATKLLMLYIVCWNR